MKSIYSLIGWLHFIIAFFTATFIFSFYIPFFNCRSIFIKLHQLVGRNNDVNLINKIRDLDTKMICQQNFVHPRSAPHHPHKINKNLFRFYT